MVARGRWWLGLTLGLFACDCGGTGPITAPLVADPVALDFGRVAVGLAAREELALVNGAGALVTIQGIDLSPELADVVRLDAVPAAIAAGRDARLQVIFSPVVRGTYQGTLRIRSSVGVLEVPATGLGYEPRLRVEPDRIHFGEVRVGTTATRAVSLYNVGDGPVQLTAITGDAETSTEFTGDLPGQQVIPAGQGTTVVLAFLPLSGGSRSGRLVIATMGEDGPDAPSVRVEGIGQASDLRLEPLQLQFGGVLLGDERVRSVELRNVSTEPRLISELRLPPSPFRILEAPPLPATLAPGQAVRISLAFRPEDLGPVGTVLEFLYDSSPFPLILPLEGRADPSPRPRLAVGGIDFGTVQVNHGISAATWVVNQGSTLGGLEVSIDPPNPVFSLVGVSPPPVLQGGHRHRVVVRAAPNTLEPFEAELVVRMPEAEVPELRRPLRVSGTAFSVPDLGVTASLDFGRVPRGQGVTRRLRLESRGLLPVRVESITSSDPRFQLGPVLLPTSIPAGQALEVPVFFGDPRGPRAVLSGQLQIQSDDPDLAVERVLLSAETAEPALLYDAFEIWLNSSDGTSDFDLHVVAPSGALFDAPDDVCACNPRPDWGTTGDLTDDPRFGDDVTGIGTETVKFSAVSFGRLEVWAYHRTGSAPATVEVGVRSGGVSFGREVRTLAPGEAAALMEIEPAQGLVSPRVDPPQQPPISECY